MSNERLEAKNPDLLQAIEQEPELCIALANNELALSKLLTRTQIALVTEDNKEGLGHTIFAMRQIHGILNSAILCGKAHIAKAAAKKEQKQ